MTRLHPPIVPPPGIHPHSPHLALSPTPTSVLYYCVDLGGGDGVWVWCAVWLLGGDTVDSGRVVACCFVERVPERRPAVSLDIPMHVCFVFGVFASPTSSPLFPPLCAMQWWCLGVRRGGGGGRASMWRMCVSSGSAGLVEKVCCVVDACCPCFVLWGRRHLPIAPSSKVKLFVGKPG